MLMSIILLTNYSLIFIGHLGNAFLILKYTYSSSFPCIDLLQFLSFVCNDVVFSL